DPLLSARAVRAVGELGLNSTLPELKKRLSDEDDQRRFWAACSLALRSDDSHALAILKSIVESSSPYRDKALQVAIRRMDVPTVNTWRIELAQDAKLMRTAIIAAGALGDPVNIPWLIEQMNTPELARVAGEAFTMITGVHIAFENLESKKPEGFEA